MTNPPAPTWPGLPIEPTATVWHQSRDGQLVDGRYRIERLLGVGGMGEVYVAQQLSIGRSVALKLLRSEMARRPQARERFYIEARAASRLNHPNIVTVFDFGAAKEGLFLVMELIVGDSLPAIMVDGPLDWRRAARLIRQAADALAHAHQNEIIHCDIKTENLMLIGRGQPDEHLKVLDFGIARIAHAGANEPTPGTAVGTPMAMAPEVILGDPPTPQADIYALGVVFFELLTKLQPYEPTSVQRLVQQKLFSPAKDFDIPGAPAHVVTELRALIAQALAPRPDLRPRSCEEVRDRLDRLLEPPPLGKDFVFGQMGVLGMDEHLVDAVSLPDRHPRRNSDPFTHAARVTRRRGGNNETAVNYGILGDKKAARKKGPGMLSLGLPSDSLLERTRRLLMTAHRMSP